MTGSKIRKILALCLGMSCIVMASARSREKISGSDPSVQKAVIQAAYKKTYDIKVTKIVDGDTVDVDFLGEVPPECEKTKQRIRLIGVDTPEYYKKVKQPYAEEAKEYTGGYLSRNMTLKLDPDTSYKDKYGRLLAYLYDKDGSMLNYDLIRLGYGRYYGKFRFNEPKMTAFEKAEKYAKKHRLGLWKLEED